MKLWYLLCVLLLLCAGQRDQSSVIVDGFIMMPSSSCLSYTKKATTTTTSAIQRTRDKESDDGSIGSICGSDSFTRLRYRNLPSDEDDDDNEDTTTTTKTNVKAAAIDDHNSNASDDDDDDDDLPAVEWSLEDDWLLMDTISKYTVVTKDNIDYAQHHAVTFWTQLMAATPRLSSKFSKEDIMTRLDELQLELEQEKSISSSKKNNLRYGPSPPILNHWTMSSSGSTKLSGQMDDGRYIWLTPQLVGRLADDPILTSSSSFGGMESVCNGMPGGYVEAVGGRVYELGVPARNRPSHTGTTKLSSSSVITNANQEEKLEGETSLLSFLSSSSPPSQGKSNHIPESLVVSSLTSWWVPATTATVSALVASCVLSACIGYGAGLSIIQDEHHVTSHDAPPVDVHHQTQQQIPASVMNNRAPGPIAASYYAQQTTGTSNSPSELVLSSQQQKERLTQKIYNEEQMVKMIQTRMILDQMELQSMSK